MCYNFFLGGCFFKLVSSQSLDQRQIFYVRIKTERLLKVVTERTVENGCRGDTAIDGIEITNNNSCGK